MNYNDVQEPSVPFPMLYNEFKREIVNAIQQYVSRGIPYCCISEIMNDFARQCVESANVELNEMSNRYNKALEDYSNYIRQQDASNNEYKQQEFVVSPDGELGVDTDGQIE